MDKKKIKTLKGVSVLVESSWLQLPLFAGDAPVMFYFGTRLTKEGKPFRGNKKAQIFETIKQGIK